MALRPGQDRALDLDGLTAAIRPDTRVVPVDFPGDPTGKVIGGAGFTAPARLCDERGIHLFSDEVHRGLERAKHCTTICDAAPCEVPARIALEARDTVLTRDRALLSADRRRRTPPGRVRGSLPQRPGRPHRSVPFRYRSGDELRKRSLADTLTSSIRLTSSGFRRAFARAPDGGPRGITATAHSDSAPRASVVA